MEYYTAFIIFIFGACIGSFLNVCIVRLPHEKSVINPPSHCVHCKKPIPWYDNIPFVSYILLKGKCRFCGGKISIRYFIVELLTAGAFLGFYLHFGLKLVLLPYLIMLSGLIVATFVDIEHRIIPDEISVGGIWVGILFSCLLPQLHEPSLETLLFGRVVMRVLIGICVFANIIRFILKKEAESIQFVALLIVFAALEWGICALVPVVSKFNAFAVRLLSFDASLIGFAIGGSAIYAMGELGDAIFKKESMGGGDVKLLAMIGAFLGWQSAILAFFIAPIFGAVVGIAVKIRTKESLIPYGPFLALGGLISLFWSRPLIHWILSGYGLYR